MRKMNILVITCLMVLFSLSAHAYAFASGLDNPSGSGTSAKIFRKLHRILKSERELNLSEEQVKKIEGEMIKAEKEAIRADAEVKIVALDIKLGLKQDNINIKALNKLIDQKYEFKKNKMKVIIEAYANIKEILTKEQKEMLGELYKSGKEKKCGMMGKEHKDKAGKCPYYSKGEGGPNR